MMGILEGLFEIDSGFGRAMQKARWQVCLGACARATIAGCSKNEENVENAEDAGLILRVGLDNRQAIAKSSVSYCTGGR
jgi:hypothetical protein